MGADRESLDRGVLRRERAKEARVDTAGEEKADRDIRDKMGNKRFLDGLLDRLERRIGLADVSLPSRRLPVPVRGTDAGGYRVFAPRAGRKFANAAKQGCGSQGSSEHEEVRQRLRIEFARCQAAGENGLRLTREHEPRRRAGIVKSFDAQAVSAEDEPFSILIPNSDCEHSLESGEDVRAPFTVTMDDHLGVRVIGSERVPLGREFFPEGTEVVDLAVEYDLNSPIIGPHRLGAMSQIQDGESIVAEAYAVPKPLTPSIGATVILPPTHASDERPYGRLIERLARYNAKDSTHWSGVRCTCQAHVLDGVWVRLCACVEGVQG